MLHERPENFRLNKYSPLANGLVFAGLGQRGGDRSTHYRDSSLYGNHGTLTDMAPETDWVWCSELNRFVVDGDGSNDKIDLSTPTHINNWPELTVACWVKTTDTGGAVIARGDWNIGPGFQLGFYSSNSSWQVIESGTKYRERRGTAVCRSGSWAHLCGTWATTGNVITTYENGVSASSALASSGTIATYASTANLYLLYGLNLGFYNGQLADVLIWSRLLSVYEISSLADPSNVMLSGLILPPRRKLWAVTGAAPPAFAGRTEIIGSGIVA